MTFRFTSKAADELEELLAYIAERSPGGAHKIANRIQEVVHQLEEFPLSGIDVGHRQMRRASAGPYPYLIYYLANGTEIVVVGIRHAARDPDTMPDKPLGSSLE